jgi:hypothetical protein
MEMNAIKEAVRRDKTLVGNLANLLAEPFGIQDSEIISEVALITGYFDACTHLIDDATDEHGYNKRASGLVHLGVDELLEGINCGLLMVHQPSQWFSRVQQYWKQASAGEKYLWKHHSNLAVYGEKDFEMLGKRGAMAKVPVSLYADLSNQENSVLPLEAGVENAAIAIQLFDDIFDWEDDIKNKIYTHPISLAYQRTGNLDSIEEGLFYHYAFNDSVAIAVRYLEKGKKFFDSCGAYQLSSKLDDFIKNALLLDEKARQFDKEGGRRNLTEEIKKITDPLLFAH